MNCQECGVRPATMHFTKIVNGDKTEYHLCDTCAREKGEMLPGATNGFSIHNLISGLLDFDPKSSAAKTQASKPLQCEECGMSYTQFSKLGRFGCSLCYEFFSDRLDPLLRRIHGNTAHVGKVPKRTGEHIQAKRELDSLKKELTQLIAHEEFEKAATIRDQIRQLEKDQHA